MRTFFGLEPDAKTKLAIESWRSKAFPALEGLVPMANFHITLLFLGDIQQLDLEPISMFPKKECNLQLQATEVGFFSKHGIGFLTITSNPQLNALRNHVIRHLPAQLRKPHKNVFVPHITLFRNLTTPLPAPLLKPNFTWLNSEYHLYQSISRSGKLSYHPLLTFK